MEKVKQPETKSAEINDAESKTVSPDRLRKIRQVMGRAALIGLSSMNLMAGGVMAKQGATTADKTGENTPSYTPASEAVTRDMPSARQQLDFDNSSENVYSAADISVTIDEAGDEAAALFEAENRRDQDGLRHITRLDEIINNSNAAKRSEAATAKELESAQQTIAEKDAEIALLRQQLAQANDNAKNLDTEDRADASEKAADKDTKEKPEDKDSKERRDGDDDKNEGDKKRSDDDKADTERPSSGDEDDPNKDEDTKREATDDDGQAADDERSGKREDGQDGGQGGGREHNQDEDTNAEDKDARGEVEVDTTERAEVARFVNWLATDAVAKITEYHTSDASDEAEDSLNDEDDNLDDLDDLDDEQGDAGSSDSGSDAEDELDDIDDDLDDEMDDDDPILHDTEEDLDEIDELVEQEKEAADELDDLDGLDESGDLDDAEDDEDSSAISDGTENGRRGEVNFSQADFEKDMKAWLEECLMDMDDDELSTAREAWAKQNANESGFPAGEIAAALYKNADSFAGQIYQSLLGKGYPATSSDKLEQTVKMMKAELSRRVPDKSRNDGDMAEATSGSENRADDDMTETASGGKNGNVATPEGGQDYEQTRGHELEGLERNGWLQALAGRTAQHLTRANALNLKRWTMLTDEDIETYLNDNLAEVLTIINDGKKESERQSINLSSEERKELVKNIRRAGAEYLSGDVEDLKNLTSEDKQQVISTIKTLVTMEVRNARGQHEFVDEAGLMAKISHILEDENERLRIEQKQPLKLSEDEYRMLLNDIRGRVNTEVRTTDEAGETRSDFTNEELEAMGAGQLRDAVRGLQRKVKNLGEQINEIREDFGKKITELEEGIEKIRDGIGEFINDLLPSGLKKAAAEFFGGMGVEVEVEDEGDDEGADEEMEEEDEENMEGEGDDEKMEEDEDIEDEAGDELEDEEKSEDELEEDEDLEDEAPEEEDLDEEIGDEEEMKDEEESGDELEEESGEEEGMEDEDDFGEIIPEEYEEDLA